MAERFSRRGPQPGPTGFIDRRGFLGAGLSVAALAALAACGAKSSSSGSPSSAPALAAEKDGDTLNLYAWDGYIAPEVIKGFESKYGIKVQQTSTASMTEMIQKFTGKQPFDVQLGNSTFLPDVSGAGLLREIPHASLSNYSQVIPEFQNPYFDPGNKYCIGYAMAPVGLAYRKDIYTNLTGSWADLWNDVDTDPGHVYLNDDYQLQLSIALMYLGLDVNTSSQDDLDKAVDALVKIKGKVKTGSTNTVQILSSGQATLIPSYTGNVYSAIAASKGATAQNLDFELCKEGQLFNDDCFTIPAVAPHPGNAMLFLDWILAPENMTANVNYIAYPVPTTAGMAAYNELVKNTPFLQFGTSLLSNTSAWEQGLSAQQRTLWNAAWLKFQSA